MGLRALRYLDLVVLALALPLFLAAGWPLEGYAACGGAWLAQRGIQAALARRAAGTDPRTSTAVLGASLLGRLWLVAAAILAVGLAEREAGLAAAVLAVVLFQVQFTALMLTRGLGPEARR